MKTVFPGQIFEIKRKDRIQKVLNPGCQWKKSPFQSFSEGILRLLIGK
jgi:hypothetical protein